MKPQMLPILTGLGYVFATEVCMPCRPIELQIAPGDCLRLLGTTLRNANSVGIGIDLTMACG